MTHGCAIESCDTGLAKRLLLLADLHELPEDHELRQCATAFETAMRDVYIGRCSEDQFVKTWMRARRAYIGFTSED